MIIRTFELMWHKIGLKVFCVVIFCFYMDCRGRCCVFRYLSLVIACIRC